MLVMRDQLAGIDSSGGLLGCTKYDVRVEARCGSQSIRVAFDYCFSYVAVEMAFKYGVDQG